jgi:hypothetical protein
VHSADVMAAASGAGIIVVGIVSAVRFLTAERDTDEPAADQPEQDDTGRKAR